MVPIKKRCELDDKRVPTTIKSEKDMNEANINEIGDESWVEGPFYNLSDVTRLKRNRRGELTCYSYYKSTASFIVNYFPNIQNESKVVRINNNKRRKMKHKRTIEIPKSVHNPSNTRTCMTDVIQV